MEADNRQSEAPSKLLTPLLSQETSDQQATGLLQSPCEAAKQRLQQQQQLELDPDSQQHQHQHPQHCCRREFHALFFGRRDSLRYRQQVDTAAGVIADPFRLRQANDETRERQERIDKQLRLQLILGGSILVIFVVTFSVIISLLLSKEELRDHLRMEPRNSQGTSGPVLLDRSNDDDLAAILGRISGELAEYEVRKWYPRFLRVGRRPKDCEALAAYPIQGREVCVPRLAVVLGVCNAYSAFGYLVGDPCVLLKPGHALTGNYTEDLLVRCQATVDADGAELDLRFHPRVTYQSRVYTYFPRYFFPYPSDDSFYLPPLAMVQVIKPPRGRTFSLNCSLANAAFANVSTQTSLQFAFE